ncbi:serine/threonine-protein kinase [Persicimonas caeni]|nr:serine/threonine-protein kinase [Persicimonas caeni]
MATSEQAKLDRLKMPDIGDLLDGRYRIQAVLATGGMGVVLRAEQLPMERPVAIKLLHPHIAAGNEKLLGRFEQEVRLAKLLNHPNTIRLYDFGESSEGLVYVAMEFLDGRDLKRLIAEEGCLPVGRAVEITRQMLDGLAEAHAHDFIHRDLKPSNVFVTENRRGEDVVKLLDFGIAKSLDGSDVDLTGSGSICGTPGYVAPEYLQSESLEKASDIYAVGLILLEMLIGQRVFKGDGAVQTMMMHLQIDPDIPPEIERTPLAPIIRKATCKRPEERYADADQMLQALEAIIEELPQDLRVDGYESPQSQGVSEKAVTPPPKVEKKLAGGSESTSLEEDSSASIPEPEPTPISVANHQSGPHSLEPPQPKADSSALSPPPLKLPKPSVSKRPAPKPPVSKPPVPKPAQSEPSQSEPSQSEPSQSEPAKQGEPVRAAVPEGETGELGVDDADFFAADSNKKVWMIGGGASACLVIALFGFLMTDPGEAPEIDAGDDEAAAAERSGEPESAADGAEAGATRALAATEDAGGDAAGADEVKKLRFDLDTDPSGATARVGEQVLGTTPLVYQVAVEELPQTVHFEQEGYAVKTTELTEESSPIVVEVLDKLDKKVERDDGARGSERAGSRRGGARNGKGRKAGGERKEKLSDDKVEKVLDEFLVE